MEYHLSNQSLEAIITSKGAELISLKRKGNNDQYIWKGDPDIWGRHAPVLFPIVGRLKNDTYRFNGQEYRLGQHGFARNQEFRCVENSPEHLCLELTDDTETLQTFPFPFTLRISYDLQGNTLTNRYEVSNNGDHAMWFSIGGHPGFTCPLDSQSSRSDYRLEFDTEETAPSHILENGTFSGRTKQVIEERTIPLTDDLFDEDALVFKGLNSEKVSIKRSSGETILHFHFQGFPYLGIWSQKQAPPYVCIEPWFGLADNHDHDGELTHKEGIQELSSGSTFSCHFGIEIP